MCIYIYICWLETFMSIADRRPYSKQSRHRGSADYELYSLYYREGHGKNRVAESIPEYDLCVPPHTAGHGQIPKA